MFKSITKISALIITIIILSLILLYWQTNIVSNRIKDILNSELEGVAKIEYSELSGNLFETISISDIIVTLNDNSQIKSKSIRIDYNLASVIFTPYLVRDFIVDSLSVRLSDNVEKARGRKTEKKEKFTINKIPTILDSLINIDSILAIFPELIVNNLKVTNSALYLTRDLQFDNVNLEMKYVYESQELDIVIENLKGYWINRNLNLNKFNCALNANKNRITLNKLHTKFDSSFIYAKSEITFADTNWIIFDLEESRIDYADIKKFAVINEVKEGFINTAFKVVGSPTNLSAQLSVNGETDKYTLDSLKVDLDFKNNVLSVLTGKILINNTYLTFNGKGSVESSYGKINFNQFNVANLIPDVINTSLTGNLSFNVDKLDLNHLTGHGEIYLVNSSIDSVRIDSLRFALLANNSNFEIIEPSVLKFGNNSSFTVEGTLDRNLVIDAVLYTENNKLTQLFTALNIDTLNGNFDANLALTGVIEDPDLRGYLFLPFIEKDSVRLDTIILDLTLNKIFSGRKGNAYFSVLRGDIQGFELTEALVNISFDSNKVLFDTLLFKNNENFISLAGILEQVQDTFNLGLNLFQINYQNYWIENSDSILLNFYPDEYVINQARFKAPGEGVLEIRGFWDKNIEDIQVGLYVENIKLNPFQQFFKSEQKIGGVLNGEVIIIDPLNSPNIESEVKGELINFDEASLGNVTMDLEYDDGSIYFKEFVLENGQTRFNARGDIALKFIEKDNKQTIDFIEGTETNLSVDWKNFDLSNYQKIIKLKNPVKGTSSGQIKISGSLKHPKLTIFVQADSVTYQKYQLTDLYFKTHFQNDSLILDTLQTEVNQTYLLAQGSQIIKTNLKDLEFIVNDQPLDLTIFSKDDRIEFIGNFMDQIEKINGEYETNIHITGTPEKPVLDTGYFNIEKANLVLSRVKNPINNVSMDVAINDSVLLIEDLTAYSVKEKDLLETGWSYIVNFFRLFKGETELEGQLTGSGSVDLANMQHPQIDLNLKMYEFFVDYFVENTQLVLTTNNMKITGKDTINIDADLIIESGNYEVDLDKLRKNIYLASTEINTERALSWNLEINIPDNFIIASSTMDLANNFELEISGDLRAIQEPNSPNMELTGHVEILSGNYVAFGQNFEIQQGSIDFSNPKKINPDIEIFAEKETGDYKVELAVNGNLDKLTQDLQIRDANGIYLSNLSLYDKLKYISGSADADLVDTGEDVISTSMYTMIERGAQDLTGLDKVKINNSEKLIDLQSMKLNNGLQDASISIGKNLTNNLYLEYRSQFGSGIPTPKLSWEPGNQISLAYKINKFWSLESAYAQTIKGNTLINISLSWKTTF